MKALQQLNITKNKKEWRVESIVTWGTNPNPTYTYLGYTTLAAALWSTIETDFEVTGITVKGKPMTNQEAYAIIKKRLQNTGLSYSLPYYRKSLGIDRKEKTR